MRVLICGFDLNASVAYGVMHCDLLILEWLKKAKECGKVLAKINDGEEYIRINYQMVVDDVSVAFCRKADVIERFDYMCERGVLKAGKNGPDVGYYAYDVVYDRLMPVDGAEYFVVAP